MSEALPIYYLVKPEELTALIMQEDIAQRRKLAAHAIAAWKDRAPKDWRTT